MSSWGITHKSKFQEFSCKLTKSGFCSNFFKYFMCYLYSQRSNKIMYLNDTISTIDTFHLILDIFKEPKNVKYTSYKTLDIYDNNIKDLVHYLSTLTEEYLREQATEIFKLNEKTEIIIKDRILQSGIPDIDIGIHIRSGDKITSGEMKELPLAHYISAIKNMAFNKTGAINIYLMTDNISIIDKLREKSEPNWIFHAMEPPIPFTEGHDQRAFNSNMNKDKILALYHFLAEIYILQRCPNIICTYSSNIGRFLHLTREPNTTIKSVDLPRFSILQHMPSFN